MASVHDDDVSWGLTYRGGFLAHERHEVGERVAARLLTVLVRAVAF